MKIKHKLLPLLAIGSTAAIVTPLVTSCSKTIVVNLELDGTELIGIHFVDAAHTYCINIDTDKFGQEIIFEGNSFVFAMNRAEGGEFPLGPEAPEEQKFYLNDEYKSEWKMVAEQETTHLVKFTIPPDIVKKGDKIKVEFSYKNNASFEPYNFDFIFAVTASVNN